MMDQLARHAAEIAQRLATFPPEGSRENTQALDLIEQMAIQILKEVSAARTGKSRKLGENSGSWPSMQPVRRY
jgi:hypothetical protein